MEEAAKRPLPYEGLTPPNDGISFWPDADWRARAQMQTIVPTEKATSNLRSETIFIPKANPALAVLAQ